MLFASDFWGHYYVTVTPSVRFPFLPLSSDHLVVALARCHAISILPKASVSDVRALTDAPMSAKDSETFLALGTIAIVETTVQYLLPRLAVILKVRTPGTPFTFRAVFIRTTSLRGAGIAGLVGDTIENDFVGRCRDIVAAITAWR